MKPKVILTAVALVAILAGGAIAATGGSGHSAATRAVVKTGHALGKKVLVTRSGMTLYSLSAEKNGRFICTNSMCTGLWHALTVPKGTKPAGASHLATIRRPDGRTQVTFQGRPLYTFTGDKKPGQAKGEGFKDVGTWHAATIGSQAPATPGPQQNSPSYPSY